MSAGVVFVNYHSEELIEPRARVLLDAGFAVVVADNSRTYPAARASAMGASVVDCGGNVGFGAACNRAVRALPADVDVVCLHNPDVVAPPAMLRELSGRVGVAHAVLAPAIHTGGRVRVSGFHYPSPSRELLISWRRTRRGLGYSAAVAPVPKASSASVRRHRGWGRRFASAALLSFRREAFDAIGGFDERFFLYGEDLELWHRFVRAGYAPGFAPDLVAEHIGRGGSPLAAASRDLLRQLGIEYFAELHAARGWAPYRRAHRVSIASLGAEAPAVDIVLDAWAAGASPGEVLDAIRPRFAGRVPVSVR